jgi:hypothetical protein
VALFPAILGTEFDALAAPLRCVHSGLSGEWIGAAQVGRGSTLAARLLCTLGGLPPSSPTQVPLRVRIEAKGGSERWQRWFGDSRAMVSSLASREGLLVERLGPVTAVVRLEVQEGCLLWTGERLSILGVPLPRGAFRVVARVWAEADVYHFDMSVAIAGVGELIRYRGWLEVEGA